VPTDEAEEEGFGQALDDVGVDQRAVGVVEVGAGVETQQGDRDEASTGDADRVREDGEEEEHEDGGGDAWGDQLADGIGAERAHGVNLFGDLHGAEFGGHAGGVAAGDHEAGEDGAEFFDHRESDEGAGHADGAELLQGGGGLKGEDAAGEKAGEDDDGKGTDADRIHLGVDICPVTGLGEEICDSPGREDGVVLNGGEDLFGKDLWGHKGHGFCGSGYQMRRRVNRL